MLDEKRAKERVMWCSNERSAGSWRIDLNALQIAKKWHRFSHCCICRWSLLGRNRTVISRVLVDHWYAYSGQRIDNINCFTK